MSLSLHVAGLARSALVGVVRSADMPGLGATEAMVATELIEYSCGQASCCFPTTGFGSASDLVASDALEMGASSELRELSGVE